MIVLWFAGLFVSACMLLYQTLGFVLMATGQVHIENMMLKIIVWMLSLFAVVTLLKGVVW
jgi:hypothetical protein